MIYSQEILIVINYISLKLSAPIDEIESSCTFKHEGDTVSVENNFGAITRYTLQNLKVIKAEEV